ncbi:Interferon a3 [Labeo rohita]|uniref:Interferon a3 n=1 Tax=Labeo rohita TaxID=84645 RepID=A0ABQ8MUE0_LABRO|nr:Interferon a3 [Labeo rohita]
MMKQTQMWTHIFVIFFTLQSQCSACKWLDRYSTLAKESLNLLEEMGGQYPENVRVPFPGSLYNLTEQAEVEDKVKFLILTSDHIISLMDATKHSVEWNTRTLQYFLKVLHRQSTELKECEDPYQKRPYKESYKKRINRHFRTLRKILKKEKYSAQAWQKIRRAVKTHLQRMNIIANSAKSSV